jgi:hypothetical protein
MLNGSPAPESGYTCEYEQDTNTILLTATAASGSPLFDLQVTYSTTDKVSGYVLAGQHHNVFTPGDYSLSNGVDAMATGDGSMASGWECNANGEFSSAFGEGSYAGGEASIAAGYGTTASGDNQTAIGKYNVADSQGQYAFIIGNGDEDGQGGIARSNALAVDWGGNVECSGAVVSGPATHGFLAGRFTYGRLSGR